MIGQDILDQFSAYIPKLIGSRTAEGHIKIIKKLLKSYSVKINKVIDTTNSSYSCLTIGGFYDFDYTFGDKDIEIFISINEYEKNDIFEINYDDAVILVRELFKTLMHELRHRHQYLSRDDFNSHQYTFNTDDAELKFEMEYYGDSDELDAYAREAAIEFHLADVSPTKDKYIKLFLNRDNNVLKRFLKKFYLAYTK